jgi:hypothetical protein
VPAELVETALRLVLSSVKCSEEDAAAAFKIVGDNSTVIELIIKQREFSPGL